VSSRLISIVVPVFNEKDSLGQLIDEIGNTAESAQLTTEVIFVDDGSKDSSWTSITELASRHDRIKGIRFRRNRGKAAALMAGFQEATGDIVFMMDADLQDPPEEMPRLLAKLDEGWDVVSGWKRTRHDPWHKVYPSRVFNKLIGRLTGLRLHDHVCGLKCFRKEVLQDIQVYGEMHRFLGVMAAAEGWSVTEVPTLHRARTRGMGKYGVTRFFKGFLDLLTITFLTRYRWRPQHVIGMTGLLTMALTLAIVIAAKLGWSWILTVLGLFGVVWSGLLFVAVGLVAEMIVANRSATEAYRIVERVGFPSEQHQPTPPPSSQD
jgi:dolichol-phosphate mannosyltransferase